MDIVLNTTFNNPNLPKLPGGIDLFERAAADTLGFTDDGREWAVLNAGTSISTWGPTGAGTAKMKSANTSAHAAVVNWGAADGRLTGILAAFDSAASSNRFGLAVRVQDMDNYIRIESSYPSSPKLNIRQTIAGVSSVLATSTLYPVAGDTIQAVLDGPTVTLLLNGVLAATAQTTGLFDATWHGMYAFAGSNAEWASIQFAA